MSRIYYINARKNVQLEQVEIEAPDEQTAIEEYLRMAHAGGIDVSDYNWHDLSTGDLDIEDHGEGKNEPF
jgi:hypothetical protein